jgi:hypothetical protein
MVRKPCGLFTPTKNKTALPQKSFKIFAQGCAYALKARESEAKANSPQ